MKPALSVIVTSYNIEQYIVQALSSVVDQGIGDLEIVLVDDGSSDRTLARAAAYLKDKPQARIVAQANGGPGAARNTGLQAVCGDYVLYLDGDDWLAPGSIALLWKEMREHPVDVVCSNRQRYIEKTNTYDPRITPFTQKRRGSVADVPEVLRRIAIHGKLFRRRFLTDNGIVFPAGMSSEDFVFSYRVCALADSVCVLPELTYFWRKRATGGSITQQRLSKFNLESRFRQIALTQEILATTDLQKRFPAANFRKVDYESRLMRHVVALKKEKNPEVQRWAMEQLRRFVDEHRDDIAACVTPGTKAIYDALLASDLKTVIELCRALT